MQIKILPKVKSVSVEFPVDLIKKLDAEAANIGISRSVLIRWAVRDYIATTEKAVHE